MSLPAVLAAAETAGTVTGVRGHSAGAPTPEVPYSDTPWLSVEWDGQWSDRFLTLGMLEMRYGVRLTLTLGGANLRPADALSLAALFKDRLRAAFSADPTLGGTCAFAYLDTGGHNLLTYFDPATAAMPFCEWVLHVTEHVAYTAASQT